MKFDQYFLCSWFWNTPCHQAGDRCRRPSKGLEREKAIEYMGSNEPITEQFAVAEIERYVVLPGQALSYKIGKLKFRERRDKYSKQLGAKFKITVFHEEILKDGSMPLTALEQNMNAGAAKR